MKQRVFTSILLLPLLFFGLISEIFLFALILSICFIVVSETNMNLTGSEKRFRATLYFFAIILSFLLIISTVKFSIYFLTLTLILFITSLILNILGLKKLDENIDISQYSLNENSNFEKIILREFSSIFYLLGIISIFFLYQSYDDLVWILIPLVTVFSVDTFSYLIGSKFGKRRVKLITKISPNKTIIGYCAGIFFGGLTFFILNIYFGNMFSNLIILIFISTFIPIISIIGDLYASGIKRNFGVKNYGTILPGHGGLLDRLDSVIVTIVFMNLVKVLDI